MASLKPIYGKETRAFVMVYLPGDGSTVNIEIRSPIYDALSDFHRDCRRGFQPLHVYLNAEEENNLYRAFCHYAGSAAHGRLSQFYRTYLQTLKEQNIDILEEIDKAAIQSHEDVARDIIRDLNERLRKHVEEYPKYYAKPNRLPGQRGALRRPGNIPPTLQLQWPEND